MSMRRAAAAVGFFLVLGAGGAPESRAAPPPAMAMPASPRSDSTLRTADLQADVAILRRTHGTLHPGLLRYNTPARIEAAFSALEGEFRQDRTLADIARGRDAELEAVLSRVRRQAPKEPKP